MTDRASSRVVCRWRGPFANDELNALHAAAFDHRVLGDDWNALVARHSLGWVSARDADDQLVGFVNVAWDGGVHAFIVDTIVAPEVARTGVGTRLVSLAAAEARRLGCEWLHVDFEDHLQPFYFNACGFRPTTAGTMRLR